MAIEFKNIIRIEEDRDSSETFTRKRAFRDMISIGNFYSIAVGYEGIRTARRLVAFDNLKIPFFSKVEPKMRAVGPDSMKGSSHSCSQGEYTPMLA